jgi:hypothetical protein
MTRPDSPLGGFPVLILHGLFQSSGSFVTSEERSLAFWLARHGGYQVYLGNTRGIFDMGHRNFSRNDPRFWGECLGPDLAQSILEQLICPGTVWHRLIMSDWTVRELAMYDLPALVDHVCQETGYDKASFAFRLRLPLFEVS